MLIRIRQIPLLFVGIAMLGILLGIKLEPWVGFRWRAKRPEIVLLGSGNVHPYVRKTVPSYVWDKMNPLWIDEGSGDALVNAFSVFNFGRSVNEDAANRVGFIAMSSNGTNKLADQFSDELTQEDRKVQNWFLSIIIAKQPLTIFYRGISDAQLKVREGTILPQELGSVHSRYAFVRLSDLKGIIEKPEMPEIIRYFPGANSGTKSRFELAAQNDSAWAGPVNWAKVGPTGSSKIREVPDYFEDLGQTTRFLELASELQEPHRSDDSMDLPLESVSHN
jgi:hypothetical protein